MFKNLTFPLLFNLTHSLFRSVLFKFQSFIDFKCNSILVKKNILQLLNPFQFIYIYFINQRMTFLNKDFFYTFMNIHSAIGLNVLHISIRSTWLMMLFKSCILEHFCRHSLSIVKSRMLTYMIIIRELFIILY